MNLTLFILSVVQDSVMRVDTTDFQYKVGLYIGGFLPFLILLVIFLLIIRKRYRFKS